jgi:Zn-finger nucleic acid-binding protein
MTTPLCPSCQERMSNVERGLGGVWSCVYCEGVWLPEAKLSTGSSARHQSEEGETEATGLVCPSCRVHSLRSLSAAPARGFVCSACAGAFLARGLVHELAPQAASPSGEAVPEFLLSLLASTTLLDPSASTALTGPFRRGKDAP